MEMQIDNITNILLMITKFHRAPIQRDKNHCKSDRINTIGQNI